MSDGKKYAPSLFSYERFRTREVLVGEVGFGGNNPIRIQSMTTTDTMDTEGTVAQSIRMIDAGCELVRITAPSKKEAFNLEPIKQALKEKGYDTPLVADIHFTPNAAEVAAGIVEKVRVNPGNYADKKKFEELEYTPEAYEAELKRIRVKFTPLVELCKANKVAVRIGTNHGSLSDRILSHYGDTPKGMVESALEFIRICEDLEFYDIIISMKASNTQVMVQAYRMLMHDMMETGRNYPLHLGVTEAGEGEDGRIKSAVGIGALLEDGIGDTIRVSLTEEPEFEIPVAQALAERYKNRKGTEIKPQHYPLDPFSYSRRKSAQIENIGDHEVPRVIHDLSHREKVTAASLFSFGLHYSIPLDKWSLTDMASDYAYIGENSIDFEIPGTFGILQDFENWEQKDRHFPMLSAVQYTEVSELNHLHFVTAAYAELDKAFLTLLRKNENTVLILHTENEHGMAELRAAYFALINAGLSTPVINWFSYSGLDESTFQLHAAADNGALLLDGLGDGVLITAQDQPAENLNRTAFGILQATRTRISKTEYISCPSCGRTLFDLQETTAKIRVRTDHLKGIKIGIMGCIVNGPGEMADADYGYVGTGKGKITLYKEQDVVKKNVPEAEAVDELIELIRLHGDWVEREELV
ncbi:MAG TPA: 4-hydroxy-3-methylbut-2-en-1-yl diphosphate synthase [Flavobacteriales bacterium]|nr:4-hydroxy-3-methylbut-2-en-1-yl diphosphate synthase [Flavobacteriales bacterium]|tara:strand:- start:291 stop:2213 length:1923 start_codon:yes stop_codon:yes gene_type:complete